MIRRTTRSPQRAKRRIRNQTRAALPRRAIRAPATRRALNLRKGTVMMPKVMRRPRVKRALK